MICISPYEDKDLDEVTRLVLHCQNDGSRPFVSLDDQPELLNIKEKYVDGGGAFWCAKENGSVIGCIGLMNYGNGVGILKKFFVYEKYRGEPIHLGRQLYSQFLSFAVKSHFQQILLDTPKNTVRAHKFYAKSGFVKIAEENLPVHFDHPYKDCDFFILTL